VSIESRPDDIRKYLQLKLDKDPEPWGMNDNLKADIIRYISKKISGIGLLVSLIINAILEQPSIHRRRTKLDEMTNGLGLGDVYEAAMERIRAQSKDKARLGIATLMWVSHSEYPLKVDDLQHAIATEKGSTELNKSDISSFKTILSYYLGLITVDKVASIVRLLNSILHDYLCSRSDLFNDVHSITAETCLTYLSLQSVKDPVFPTGQASDRPAYRPKARPRQAAPAISLGGYRPNSISLRKPTRPDRSL
ncbi:hypothetical protein L873DRAFT_1671228, partial [Choiromyces venosus 120613-1]